MYLNAISNYPTNEASGIPRNATIWVQFNKTLDVSTVNYLTVTVATPDDGYVPLEGTVLTAASSGGYADTIIKFTPDIAFDPYIRYGFFIQGGSNGIKSYEGDTLPTNITYYFTTGGQTTTNDDLPASGVPEASGYIPTEKLQVISTYPENYDTNMATNLQYIKITFNDTIPSGINLYDKIKITAKRIM